MHVPEELLKKCANGEQRAQNELFNICYGPIMAICLRYEKNKEDAQYLLNNAFLKILRNIGKYQGDAAFYSWMKRITVNTIIDNYRRNKKRLEHIDYQDAQESFKMSKAVDYNQAALDLDAADLQEMIQKLTDTTRTVFNMHVIEGYKHHEIAEKLDMAEGTSKWHVNHARKQLQEMVKNRLK